VQSSNTPGTALTRYSRGISDMHSAAETVVTVVTARSLSGYLQEAQYISTVLIRFVT
jgi:hypothetical protein